MARSCWGRARMAPLPLDRETQPIAAVAQRQGLSSRPVTAAVTATCRRVERTGSHGVDQPLRPFGHVLGTAGPTSATRTATNACKCLARTYGSVGPSEALRGRPLPSGSRSS